MLGIFSSLLLIIVSTDLWSAAQAANQALKIPSLHELIPMLGSEQATVTILVFTDFDCFQCGRSEAVLRNILQERSDMKLIFKNAPATSNKEAMLAHEAAVAASSQGKFWEMHDILFANQQRLGRDDSIENSKELGLHVDVFSWALDDHKYRSRIEQNLEEAKGLGVTTTLTFLSTGVA